jgi:hypothetical protein
VSGRPNSSAASASRWCRICLELGKTFETIPRCMSPGVSKRAARWMRGQPEAVSGCAVPPQARTCTTT